jgi:hypothetical protein
MKASFEVLWLRAAVVLVVWNREPGYARRFVVTETAGKSAIHRVSATINRLPKVVSFPLGSYVVNSCREVKSWGEDK